MNIYQEYPGTSEHKKLLHAVVSYYHNDPRILAVILFGSLGRGNWDRYSDLDLDIVVVEDVEIDVIEELTLLCKSLTSIDEQQDRLATTLPQYDLHSAWRALLQLLDFLEQDLEQLTGGQVQLTEVQREIVEQVRRRQAELQ